MFNRYWRSYPWYLQLLQFIGLMLIVASLFAVAAPPVLLKLTGISAEDFLQLSENSPRKVINLGLAIQFFSSLGIFLLPALLFAYFAHPRPMAYLGLKKPEKPIHLVLCIAIILSATPVLLFIGEMMTKLDFGALKQTQEVNDRMVKAFLTMKSPLQFAASFFVIAILAGVGEELFFRGLLMRFSAKRSFHRYLPIYIAAALFALMHTNLSGMLSIYIAGVLLGYFYYLTGSIWCSIAAHIFYNGTQVILIYFVGNDPTESKEMAIPLAMAIASLVVSAGLFMLLWKQRTPLPNNWAADYTEEELIQEKQDQNIS